MPDLHAILEILQGDSLALQWTVPRLPAGAVIVAAWFTVKAAYTDAYNAAKIAKRVTTTATADGQVTDDGAVSGVGAVTFTLTPANSRALTDVGFRAYVYDFQVKTDAGDVFTPERGTVTVLPEVTNSDT